MLAALWNLPTTPETLSWFTFSNQQHHAAISGSVWSQLGLVLPQWPLDPLPPDQTTWLYDHQQMHNQQNAVLGIVGNDLTELDFHDISQLTDWIELHAREHQQAAEILGI